MCTTGGNEVPRDASVAGVGKAGGDTSIGSVIRVSRDTCAAGTGKVGGNGGLNPVDWVLWDASGEAVGEAGGSHSLDLVRFTTGIVSYSGITSPRASEDMTADGWSVCIRLQGGKAGFLLHWPLLTCTGIKFEKAE